MATSGDYIRQKIYLTVLYIKSLTNELNGDFQHSIKIIPNTNIDLNLTLINNYKIKKFLFDTSDNKYLSGNELKYVTKCIRTEWISTGGPYISIFEKMAFTT